MPKLSTYPYTQPVSEILDKHNKPVEVTEFVAGERYLICPDIVCNHRIAIQTQRKISKVQVSHPKRPIGKLFCQPIGRKKQKKLEQLTTERILMMWQSTLVQVVE